MSRNAHKPSLPIQAWLLAAFMVGLVLFAAYLFLQRGVWLPPSASRHGGALDFEFNLILALTGFMFAVIQLGLGWLAWKYGRRRAPHQYSVQSRRFEIGFLAVAACLIFAIDIVLFAMGEGQYRRFRGAAPEDSLIVEVTGEQFAWNFHYPGDDGVFGRTDVGLIDLQSNPIGLDRTDPNAADDVLTLNEMHLPVNRPVRVRLRSKDVLHSFSLPHLRVKQDAMPGMAVEIWFTPTTTGDFEIVCNQLCGLAHYRMRAFLTVGSDDEFRGWLAARREEN